MAWKWTTSTEGPFGEVVRGSGPVAGLNPFQFSTKYTDAETGLKYYGSRSYNPSTGRWLSRDLIGENGGINLYEYAQNNALSSIDSIGWSSYPQPVPAPAPTPGSCKPSGYDWSENDHSILNNIPIIGSWSPTYTCKCKCKDCQGNTHFRTAWTESPTDPEIKLENDKSLAEIIEDELDEEFKEINVALQTELVTTEDKIQVDEAEESQYRLDVSKLEGKCASNCSK